MRARIRQRRRSVAADRTGTAAVEFALLFPVMLTLFLGSYELENYLMAYLKVTAAAETAADLVAQTNITGGSGGNGVLQSADFTSFVNATADLLTPLPTGTNNSAVKVAFASVTYKTGAPLIDWHVEANGATAITTGNLPNGVSLTNLGNTPTNPNDSVIVAQVTYTYNSPLTYVLKSSYTISEASFNRPRYVACVPNEASTGGTITVTTSDSNNTCP